MPVTPDALNSSPVYEYYAGAVVDTNLVAAGGNVCRRIRCNTAGDLKVVRPDGTEKTLPFTAGESQDIQARSLVASGSTATGITVYW